MPRIMAMFFIAIAIARVSDFLGAGIKMGIWGDIFACGLAYCVYMSASIAAKEESRKSGWTGVIVFGLLDLFYNELGLVYRLSPETLIAPQAKFLWLNAEQITVAIHWGAVLFGASPTIASMVLGWQNSEVEKVKDWGRPGFWSRILSALSRILNGVSMAVAIRFEAAAMFAMRNAPSLPGESPANDAENGQFVAVRKWKSLTAEEVARIPAMSRAEMTALFGISDGAAGDWKRKVLAGERPWKQLT